MKTNKNDRLFIFLFIDLSILNLSIVFAIWASEYFWSKPIIDSEIYWLQANMVWTITYFLFFSENFHLHNGFVNQILRITKCSISFLIILSVPIFIFPPQNFSHSFFFLYVGLFYVGRLLFYTALHRFLKYKRQTGINTKRVLIVGLNETTRFLCRLIENNPLLGYRVIGYVSSSKESNEEILGAETALSEIIHKYNIHLVFASLSVFAENNHGNIYLRTCNQLGVRLRFIPENQPWLKASVIPKSVQDIVVINPQHIPLDDLGLRVCKRFFDILFSSLVIVFIFTWLFPILAILIRLESKGPVFFIQKRTGINNRDFNCIKFRSMTVNKDADILQASQEDSRITRMGCWMRKTNVDELPQFFNVLVGQMSVVGPRPHMLKHTEEYSAHIKYYLVRHYVKPGITGWAQVNGWRGPTDNRLQKCGRVLHDLWYVKHWSFQLDLWIIILTVIGKKTRLNAF